MEELTAKISAILFSNHATGFHILRTIQDGQSNPISVKGNFLGIPIGIGLKAKFLGRYEQHEKFGRQFSASVCEIIPDKGRNGVITYLVANVPSIGPITAARLYDAFGDDLLRILDEEPDKISELSFLNRNQIAAIQKEWSSASENRTISIFLAELGLGPIAIKNVLTRFGVTDARAVITDDPYSLTEVPGIGFVVADQAARKLGIGIDDPRRLRSIILFVMSQLASNEGHLFCTSDQIRNYAAKTLFSCNNIEPFSHGRYLSDSHLYSSIVELQELGDIHTDGNRLYLDQHWMDEYGSAEALASILDQEPYDFGNLGMVLAEFEKKYELQLSDEQREAFLAIKKSRVLTISGYPGTGKTLLISAFVHLFERNNLHYSLLSPTGIAAKLLSQVTNKPAFTIHRALGYKRDGSWEFNRHNKYDVDAIIVDEMCLPYKQYVNLSDGSKEYIGTIVNNKKQVSVLSYNKITGKVEPKRIINWFKYERKGDLYEINASVLETHSNNRIIRCTGNHKIYTTEKILKKASNLKVGDKIVVRGRFMNDFQKSFIMGSLLGDACCNRFSKNSCCFSFVHGEAQREYLQFKARLFHSKEYLSRGGFKPSKQLYRSDSPHLEEAINIYKLIYKNKRKTISREWLDQINEIGLSAWYMDDGQLVKERGKRSKHSTLSVKFHTEGFTKQENIIIRKWLNEKWGIKSSIYKNGKGHYFIRLFSESAYHLWDIIRPYIHECMAYKLPKCDVNNYINDSFFSFEPWKNIKFFEIQKIKKYTPCDKYNRYVYDIEVEDNHNYFSNNILVSNSMVDMQTFCRLITALSKKTVIIMVGDSAQLPSVGAGYVLHHLMECDVVPHVSLTRIYRQEKLSAIIKTSHAILRGESIDTQFDKQSEVMFLNYPQNEVVDQICQLTYLMKEKGSNFQVIAPVYDGDLGVHDLNRRMRSVLNPSYNPELTNFVKQGDTDLYEGDRIMIIQNDYDKMIYNGDVGKITRISLRDDEVDVKVFNWFDQESSCYINKIFTFKVEEVRQLLRVAYACTVHKCVSPDTLVETPNGLCRINNIKESGMIATPSGHSLYREKIANIPSKMLRIITVDGYIIEVTPDHGMDVWDDNIGYIRRPASALMEGNILSLKLGYEWGSQEFQSLPIPITGVNNEIIHKLPTVLDCDVAEFFGLMVADGTIYHGGFRLVKNSTDVVDRFIVLCESLFGVEAKRGLHNGTDGAEVSSTYIARWLSQIDGLEACNKAIPYIIIQSSLVIQSRFLRGLFEDGTVNINKKREISDHIELVTSVESIYKDVKVMLLRFGIISGLAWHRRVLSDGCTKKYHAICIYGCNIRKFAEQIGFITKWKQERALLPCGIDKKYQVPILKSEALAIRDANGGPQFFTLSDKNVLIRKRMSRHQLSDMLRRAVNITDDHRKLQLRLDFHHSAISSIEEFIGPSVCIEVPDGHRFIQNGFCGWNCQGQEFDYVIMPMTMRYGIMLYRNLIYTAITRARKKVFIFGDPRAFTVAVMNERETVRNSNLSSLIHTCFDMARARVIHES